MKTPFLAVTLLALSSSFANAEINSLSGKVMSDLTATKIGNTSMPTVQVDTNSIAYKFTSDRIGLNAGRTATPLAQPDDQSLSGRVMHNLDARS